MSHLSACFMSAGCCRPEELCVIITSNPCVIYAYPSLDISTGSYSAPSSIF